MSFAEEIKIVKVDDLAARWEEMQEGEIFILTNVGFSMQLATSDFGRVKEVFDNDPSLGFVTTDVEHYDSGMTIYQSISPNDIGEVPIFVKKVSGFQIHVDPNSPVVSVARSYMNNGLKYEHIADPYFGFSV